METKISTQESDAMCAAPDALIISIIFFLILVHLFIYATCHRHKIFCKEVFQNNFLFVLKIFQNLNFNIISFIFLPLNNLIFLPISCELNFIF